MACKRSPVRLRHSPPKARSTPVERAFSFSKRALARASRTSGKVAGSTPKCYTKGPCGITPDGLFLSKHPIKMPQIESLCYVYILYSPSKDKFYVGYTYQLADRFLRHQSGRSKSSKAGRPWLLVYLEGFETSKQAYQREVQIKRRKSRNYLLELISGHKANPFPIPG
jgi:putative endonuclease